MNGYGGSGGWQAPPQGAAAAVRELPDWTAMAEAREREISRRRRMRLGIGLGGGALAVAGILAVAVSVQGSPGGTPAGGQRPTAAARAVTAASAAPGSVPSAAAPKGVEGLKLGPAAHAAPADGRGGPALTLPGGSDGWAETDTSGVDTSAGFTVSAVVRNEAPSEPRAAVSEGNDAFFAFYLGREDNATEKNRNQWVFKVQTAGEAGKTVMALSGSPAAADRWTTLTGVYDAKAKTVSLYVDGALAKTVPAPSVLAASGPLEIGRARYKSHWADAWNGAVTDVRLWNQPLTAAQIAKADVSPRGAWLHA